MMHFGPQATKTLLWYMQLLSNQGSIRPVCDRWAVKCHCVPHQGQGPTRCHAVCNIAARHSRAVRTKPQVVTWWQLLPLPRSALFCATRHQRTVLFQWLAVAAASYWREYARCCDHNKQSGTYVTVEALFSSASWQHCLFM